MTCEEMKRKLEKKLGRKLTLKEEKYIEDMMHHAQIEFSEGKREEMVVA